MAGDGDGERPQRPPPSAPPGQSDPLLAGSTDGRTRAADRSQVGLAVGTSDHRSAPPFQADESLIGYIEEANEGPRPARSHVVPNPDGGWDVKKPGARWESSHHDTRTDAIRRAKKMARKAGGEIFVHARGGRSRDRDQAPSERT